MAGIRKGEWIVVPSYDENGATGRWALIQVQSSRGGERPAEYGSDRHALELKATRLNGAR